MESKYFTVNKNGHSIKCKIYYNNIRSIDKLVLFGTGFAGHKDNKASERFAETLLSKQKKAAVLTFNWPCHGDDVKKKMSLADCDEYITLVLDYIRDELNVSNIYGYATSFGGYMFLRYIEQNGNPFVKIALRSPAINIYESIISSIMKRGDMELLEKGKDVAIGFDNKVNVTKQFIEDLKNYYIREKDFIDFADDILIIQGTKDEIIPCEVVFDFAENNVIEYIKVENANHRFQDYAQMGNAIRDIIEFFG